MRPSPKLNLTKGLPPIVIAKNCISARSASKGCPARDRERGAGRLKAILWTLVFVSFIYVTVKVLPALINDFEFQDGIQTIARFASATRQTQEQMLAAVLKEAKKDDVPVDEKDIKIEAVNGNVKIHVDYSVTIDLTVYQWTLNFHPSAGNDSLT